MSVKSVSTLALGVSTSTFLIQCTQAAPGGEGGDGDSSTITTTMYSNSTDCNPQMQLGDVPVQTNVCIPNALGGGGYVKITCQDKNTIMINTHKTAECTDPRPQEKEVTLGKCEGLPMQMSVKYDGTCGDVTEGEEDDKDTVNIDQGDEFEAEKDEEGEDDDDDVDDVDLDELEDDEEEGDDEEFEEEEGEGAVSSAVSVLSSVSSMLGVIMLSCLLL